MAIGRRIADVIPNATLAVIENAGHIPSVDHPTEVARILREFVDAP